MILLLEHDVKIQYNKRRLFILTQIKIQGNTIGKVNLNKFLSGKKLYPLC